MAKAPPYEGLTGDTPPSHAARTIVRALADAAFGQTPAVLRGDDVRAVHDMRVALRRLRSAIATFDGAFPRDERHALRRALRRLATKLGAVRDADVHLAALRAALGASPPEARPGIHYVIDTLVVRRRAALSRFAIELSQFDRDAVVFALPDA